MTKWFQRWAAREALTDDALLSAVERANVNEKELKALKLLTSELLGYIDPTLEKALKAGELIEVNING